MKMVWTPEGLPETGRSFVINIPDGEPWLALMLGVLQLLTLEGYWRETPDGVTVEDTIAAFTDAFWSLDYEGGTPDE
jgi:hypothetical protein